MRGRRTVRLLPLGSVTVSTYTIFTRCVRAFLTAATSRFCPRADGFTRMALRPAAGRKMGLATPMVVAPTRSLAVTEQASEQL